MNVTVINGSPRDENSNTMKLTRAFLDGASFQSAEIVSVARSEIKPCLGCFVCWNKTPGKCVIGDDMSGILAKILAADIVIWSFPLYYFSVPGGLKNLIDRQLPMNLPFMTADAESGGHPSRFDLSRQRNIVISTCGFWTSEGNYDGITALFDHFCGVGKYAKIFCGQGELFQVPELRNRTEEYLEFVRRAGAEYAASGAISLETQTELATPLYAREAFEKMADASWGVSESGTPTGDDSLNFTTQMAALYKPDGKERVLEFHYTDLGKTYQVLLTKQGSAVIADDFKPYTTRIETPYEVWRSIARGDIVGEEALFQRKYKVLGDFDVMLHWDDLFGSGMAKPMKTATTGGRKTNMTVLLFPWIVIWVTLAINPTIGGTIGIIASAFVPLAWLLAVPVLYERISVLFVTGLSLVAILGADVKLILPLSYGVFGLMWFVTTFMKTPLTANYSMNNYGADKAFSNRLFIRTNRILTAAWGILYLITPIWTYFLMGTSVSAFTGLFNSVTPALMGIFTAWFQKWYPARYARG
jgi:multimeric flavodoxin WrbA/putative sterol carrier protein